MVRGEFKQASFQGNSCFIKNSGTRSYGLELACEIFIYLDDPQY